MIMTNKKLMTLVAIVLLTLVGSAMADTYFVQVAHADAFEIMGQKQPEMNDTTVIWLGDGRSCSTTGSDRAMLYEAGASKMTTVNHGDQTFSDIPLDMLSDSDQDAGEMDEDQQALAMARAMMGELEVTVTPTEETGKVGDWSARKFDVAIALGLMKIDQEIWATDEIDADADMYNALRDGMMARMPGFEKLINAMKQIEGMPVKTVSTVNAMGQQLTTTTTLIEYDQRDAPVGIYDIPEDYKKVPLETGMGMGKR
jgi:hypothetical protein